MQREKLHSLTSLLQRRDLQAYALAYLGVKHKIACSSKSCREAILRVTGTPKVSMTMLTYGFGLTTMMQHDLKRGDTVVKRLDVHEEVHSQAAVLIVDDVLYAFGGRRLRSSKRDLSAVDTAIKLDLNDGSCVTLAPMATARRSAIALRVANDLIVIGGILGCAYYYSEDDLELSSAVEILNLESHSWRTAPALNDHTFEAPSIAALAGHHIYVLHGWKDRTTILFQKLNTSLLDSWHFFEIDVPGDLQPTRHEFRSYPVLAGERVCFFNYGGDVFDGMHGGNAFSLRLDRLVFEPLPAISLNSLGVPSSVRGFMVDADLYLVGTHKLEYKRRGVLRYPSIVMCSNDTWRVVPTKHKAWLKFHAKGCNLIVFHVYAGALNDGSRSSMANPMANCSKAADEVIEDVHHRELPAVISPEEASAITSEAWAQHIEAMRDRSIQEFRSDRMLLLDFQRHPECFHTAIRSSTEFQECREHLQRNGLAFQLPCKAFVLVEPWQYRVAVDAAMEHTQGHLRPHHVITTERYESKVAQVISKLPSRSNVRLRRKMPIFNPHTVQVTRTFLEVPERMLRNATSVTGSTSEAHGALNPRR
eukprot:TRINITY_DN9569_c0_g1_i1.p1 TRINITY_DN9569_c0_g1~~TRINITY_DN9569_c0_g1_i1.p1  ORF type:complete len:590 (-),score=47.84 TRINITY_DN9569_c0_g1_i1:229-1998(-)